MSNHIPLKTYLDYKSQRKAKFVIYTAISNNFDDLIQHSFICKDADYVCYTDKPVENPGIWEIRSLETRNLDRVRSAKYYKLFAHELFPEYAYSFWIDANIDVITLQLEKRVDELINSGNLISANIHFERHCAYDEAQVCLFAKLDDPTVILDEVHYLESQKFPRGYGLFEMNMIFRQHHQEKNKRLMQDWWEMILKFSKRDQISFTYALHQQQVTCEKLFPLNSRLGQDFAYKSHNKKMHSVLYLDTGAGFQPHQMVNAECFMGNDSCFTLLFDTSGFSGIEQVRFDPVRDVFCSLAINKLIITLKNGETKNLQLAHLSECCVTNGVLNKDGVIEFDTLNPQVILKVADEIAQVHIEGNIYHQSAGKKVDDLNKRVETILFEKHEQDIHVGELQQSIAQFQLQTQKLQAHISEIFASRTWRLGKALLWLPKLLFRRG